MFAEIAYTLFVLASAAFIIFLTFRFKLNPFYILVPASFIFGMVSGVSPANTITAVRNGFGATIGYYGIMIITGTIIGVIMEKTGAVFTITNAVIKLSGKKQSPAALTAAGSILSVSCPSESGFVLFSPIAKFLENENRKKAGTVSIALASGIYIAHALIPPSAGPLASAGILGAPVWKIVLLGLISAAAGISASYFWCRYFIPQDDDFTSQLSWKSHLPDKELPSFAASILPVAVPLLLISLKTISATSSKPFGSGIVSSFFDFAGDLPVAFLIGLFLSLALLKKQDFGRIFSEWAAESIERSAKLLIIAGSGGAFGAVLKATTLTKTVSESFAFTGAGLLLPFLISAAIKTINGSSTLAVITASTITASFIQGTGLDPAFAAAAISAGSIVASHANDPYFWIVSEYSGTGSKDSYRFFTTSTIAGGAASFTVIWLLSFAAG